MRQKHTPPPHNQALLDEVHAAGLKLISLSSALKYKSYSTFITYLNGYRQFKDPDDWADFKDRVRKAIVRLVAKRERMK